jgi:TRAP-type C4-dicarboxylate transport system permease small subunit
MAKAYRCAMEALYRLCIAVASVALLAMTLSVPYGVFMRYVLNDAASWPEPAAILMVLVFTFIGAAACYRAGVHIAVQLLTNRLPAAPQRAVVGFVHLVMTAIALFMLIWGARLVGVTWTQYLAEFTWLRTGISYLPIPVGGAVTLLFILERVWLGPPPPESYTFREPLED